MFRDFYASKRLTQVSNNNTISVPSLTHRTHATRRENHPPFESPRFNQREKANEGSHLHSPRANTTPPLFLQQQTTATQNNNNNNQTSSPSNVPVVVQNVEKAKSASRYGNEVLFSVSQPQYYCHQSTPKESTPCFHSRETVELRRKNEEQRERAANTFLLQQQHQQQRKKNEEYLQALAMRPMSPPEFTNGTGTVLTAEKRVAVAGTQTDENNEENETNARKARQSRRLAGLPPPVTSTGKREDEETIDELDISKRITSAVEKTLESVAKETRRGMEEIAMRTQRDVLRCAADVARMQRDLSEFMGRYGVKRKNSHRDDDDDDDDNEDDVVYFGHTSEREIDATKTASKKKQSTMISGGKTPALVSMISDGKTPTNVVIAHIRENASIVELRAAHPLLFNGALSIRNHTASFLRKKISEGYVGYAAERERALAPTMPPDKEKEEFEMENNDIFTSRSKPKNKAVPIDDDDSDDENVELRVREEIEAFKRKTKARTARRRGFAVSTKLSIET